MEDFIVDDAQNRVLFTNVTFVLRPDKQFGLIQALMQYEPFTLSKLSQLLNISAEKLTAVLEQKSILPPKDAENLAKYFCMFFGS